MPATPSADYLLALHGTLQVSRCSTPYEAAKAIVAAAYKQWLQRETRTDDITCVVMFFQGLEHPTPKHGTRCAGNKSKGHATS